jgi:hypothetical protein
MRNLFVLTVLGAVASGAWPHAVFVGDKTVKVEQVWKASSAAKKDNDLWKQAPKSGVIAGPKAWAKLWKSWNGDKEVPKVNFDKELVLVAAGLGPNIIEVQELKLSDKGELLFEWSITDKDGDGFVATMLKVSRAGIKTVNGKGLPKE